MANKLSPSEVEKLSESDLRTNLKSFGIEAGPITPTTRYLWEKKLNTFFEQVKPLDSKSDSKSTYGLSTSPKENARETPLLRRSNRKNKPDPGTKLPDHNRNIEGKFLSAKESQPNSTRSKETTNDNTSSINTSVGNDDKANKSTASYFESWKTDFSQHSVETLLKRTHKLLSPNSESKTAKDTKKGKLEKEEKWKEIHEEIEACYEEETDIETDLQIGHSMLQEAEERLNRMLITKDLKEAAVAETLLSGGHKKVILGEERLKSLRLKIFNLLDESFQKESDKDKVHDIIMHFMK